METLVVGGIISFIGTFLSALAIYRISRQTERMDKFAEAISTLESTAVSDSHVRQVIREEMQQITTMLPRLMDSMHKVELHIAEEKGFKAAQALRREVMNNQQ